MFFGRTFGLITQRSQVQILTPLPLARPREVYPHAAFLRSPVFSYPPIPACSTEIAAVAPPETARADVAPGWGPLYSHAEKPQGSPDFPSIARPGFGQVTEFVAVALPDFTSSRAMGTFRGRISESQLPAPKSGVLGKGPLAVTRIPSTINACGADSLSMGVMRVGPRSARARSASSKLALSWGKTGPDAPQGESPDAERPRMKMTARHRVAKSRHSNFPQMKKAPAPTEALFCFHNPHPSRKEDYAP